MYLVDTNVVSDAQKGVTEPTMWLKSVSPLLVYISVITIGEIERGIELIRPSRASKAQDLDRWLNKIRRENADRILPVTETVALEWGRLSAKRRGGEADGLIAATALVHGFTVVTRNVSDFADTGVPVVNPWVT